MDFITQGCRVQVMRGFRVSLHHACIPVGGKAMQVCLSEGLSYVPVQRSARVCLVAFNENRHCKATLKGRQQGFDQCRCQLSQDVYCFPAHPLHRQCCGA